MTLLILLIVLSLNVVARAEMGFHDESELGTVINTGATTSATYNAKQMNSYDWENNLVKGTFRYLNTQTNGVDTTKNWDGTLRYERTLSAIFSAFGSYGLESDLSSGYVQRNNLDLGGKYFAIKSEETNLFFEAGYRNSSIHFPSATQSDNTMNAARAYAEVNENIGKAATFRFWIEYVQTLSSNLTGTTGYSVGQDYQVNTEPSLSVMLSQVFSLKTAYLFKYTNYLPVSSTPTKNLNTAFTTSLVAKF